MSGEYAAKLLWDAHEAAERVMRLVQDRAFDDYLANEMLRWAVERQFMVLGEALSALRRLDPAAADKIPDLGRIVAFRNVLVHGYAAVDDRLVWGIVERDLANLQLVLSRLLEPPSPPGQE